jgi:hypothetical protein
VDVVNLANVRARLVELLEFDTNWPVVDEAVSMELHPPLVLLRYTSSVSVNVMGGRMGAFTARLMIDPATETSQFDLLLEAISDDGWVDQLDALSSAESTHWSACIVGTDVTISDEMNGQIVAPYVDIPIEVWG